jgi:NADH-quinone oxidoreductase subunit N
VVAFSPAGNTSVIFYILVYSLASLGAFGVVAVLTDTLGRDAEINDFNGCWKTTPGLAAAFLVFVLSLAGIPPLAGFLGKFYLFYAAIEAVPEAASWHDGFYWLVAFALIMSVVSLYYYLRVLKAFLVAPADDGAAIAPSKIGWAAGVTLCVLALAVVALASGRNHYLACCKLIRESRIDANCWVKRRGCRGAENRRVGFSIIVLVLRTSSSKKITTKGTKE